MDRKPNPAGCLIVFVAIVAALAGIVAVIDYAVTHLRPAADQAEEQTVEEEHTVVLAGAPVASADAVAEPMIRTYTEGESPVPEWWQPGEEMAVEWVASCQQVTEINSDNELASFSKFSASYQQVNPLQSDTVDYNAQAIAHPPVGIAPGGIDWNIETELVGWDGHRMAVWEMDLFARIAYLEFWGCSAECIEAGVDSILNLWNLGEYGRTMGDLLSAQYSPGYYVYSPYPYVWEWDYDYSGLAAIRKICEERFASGPVWVAPYFRLWFYHDWAVPAYEIDGVYFSVAK